MDMLNEEEKKEVVMEVLKTLGEIREQAKKTNVYAPFVNPDNTSSSSSSNNKDYGGDNGDKWKQRFIGAISTAIIGFFVWLMQFAIQEWVKSAQVETQKIETIEKDQLRLQNDLDRLDSRMNRIEEASNKILEKLEKL